MAHAAEMDAFHSTGLAGGHAWEEEGGEEWEDEFSVTHVHHTFYGFAIKSMGGQKRGISSAPRLGIEPPSR